MKRTVEMHAHTRNKLKKTTHLLSDDGEHLELDAVELVEAGPAAARRQTLEELAHGDVVETVRAVEYDALHGQR